jgi:hypothetical protein
MEEEVAARGAPRDRQRSARIHDASSGHARPIEANAVPTSLHVISATWPHRIDGFESAAGGRHFKKPQRNLPSSSAFGATSVGSFWIFFAGADGPF